MGHHSSGRRERDLEETPQTPYELTYWDHCPRQESRIMNSLPSAQLNELAVQGLRDGKLVAATDGSFDPHRRRAACSWLLSSRCENIQISGVCPVDGDHETLDSYRAELERIWALAYYIRFLRRTHADFVEPIKLTIWIDNEQALRHRTGGGSVRPSPDKLLNESDIVEDIRQVSQDYNIQWKGLHVKSHQEGDSDDMPLEVRLNEECDRLAKRCLRDTPSPSRNSAQRSPSDLATLRVGGRMITNNFRSRLQHAAMSIDMAE